MSRRRFNNSRFNNTGIAPGVLCCLICIVMAGMGPTAAACELDQPVSANTISDDPPPHRGISVDWEPDETRREPDETEGSRLTRALDEFERNPTWRWLEAQRDDVSRNVSVVGRNLDDWLAGEGIGERSNQSYLRLRLNQRVGRYNSYYSNVRISGRIDLPRTADRWQLIFESENVEQNSLRDQRLSNISPSSFSGGFRYELRERNGWRFNHDIGARARLPIDPFYRFRARYGVDLKNNWYAGFNNRIYYYLQEGWGQDTRVFFNRELNSRLNFRLESEVNYMHQGRLTEFAQSASLVQELGEFETMTYEIGLIGRNRPIASVENYYMQMVYRKAIYEDWLVLEIVPQLLFEDQYQWQPDPRVQLNIEIFFFEF
jgi:hypothetical protein